MGGLCVGLHDCERGSGNGATKGTILEPNQTTEGEASRTSGGNEVALLLFCFLWQGKIAVRYCLLRLTRLQGAVPLQLQP